jgi:hypothetical protein
VNFVLSIGKYLLFDNNWSVLKYRANLTFKMETKLEELLKQVHRYLFADSEQVIIELRLYLLDRALSEAQLGKSTSKLDYKFLYSLYLLKDL